MCVAAGSYIIQLWEWAIRCTYQFSLSYRKYDVTKFSELLSELLVIKVQKKKVYKPV
jgi:hypothetical protein